MTRELLNILEYLYGSVKAQLPLRTLDERPKTAGKSVAFRPGQFCRAHFAVFAARRKPVWSTRERTRTGALTMVNELE